MTAGLLGCTRPLACAYDLALVDLDGVVYRGPASVEYAPESLGAARELGMGLIYVTNNASRAPESVADQLTNLGIATAAQEVVTSAQAAASLLETRIDPGAKVLVVGAHGLRAAVQEAGFVIVDSAEDHPVAVVQGYGPEVGWTQLAEAAYAVEAGAWHVASNLDLSIPTARGIAPGNGTLVRAVQAATGVVPDSAGKPLPTMYDMAVRRIGAQRALVIGDRLDTDLAGARSGGYAGLHVLTGVNTARDALLAQPGLRPHFFGADLRSLLEPHPLPVLRDGWWSCGGALARIVAGGLELSGHTGTIDTVRAAASAVWSEVDAGGTVDPGRVPEIVVE